MNDNISILEADAAARPKADLGALRAKAARLCAIESELAELAETEKRLKKEREDLRIHQLPELMFEMDMTLIGVGDKVVELEDMIQASFPKEPERIEAAVNWLVDNREGGVIKRALALELPKGDAVIERKVLDAIVGVSPALRPEVRPTVHFQTYLALCRRLVRSGATIPLDVLGVFVGHIVRVRDK